MLAIREFEKGGVGNFIRSRRLAVVPKNLMNFWKNSDFSRL